MRSFAVSWRVVLVAALLWQAAWTASAQDFDVEEGNIGVDVLVDYLTVCRDGSWVPVDVVVANNRSDVDGWVEVRVFGASDLESPIYRIRAESPKGSVKRFRGYCRLDKALRLEAMLFHKKRAVMTVPMRIDLRPIGTEDFLCLILEDEPGQFGFLYGVVHSEGESRGFYHVDLSTETLFALPDHSVCYETYDMVIMGEVDPERMSLRHRELLVDYVARGGTLAVCLGENARLYRGSWIEELLGVRVGAQETMNERALAEAVFARDECDGAAASRNCVVTEISPGPGVTHLRGRKPVLATLTPIGKGYAATLAVDSQSNALQDCIGYRALWRDLCRLRKWEDKLDFDAAAAATGTAVPESTGIRIYPRSSVLTYLGLYVAIAVVANWIVWSILKRREMAWVCLVLFSAGFTAYAMYFGTQGRAKASELHQFQVIHVPRFGQAARVHALTGVLTARTSRYDFDLADQHVLVAEPSGVSSFWDGGGFLGRGERPFMWVRDARSRVEDLAVGASEFRMFEVEGEIPMAGGVTGQLMADEDGLHGALFNETGYSIDDPFLLIDGQVIRLRSSDSTFEIVGRTNLRGIGGFDARGIGFVLPNTGWGTAQFAFTAALLSTRNTHTLNAALGPFVCGWIREPIQGPAMPSEPISRRFDHTFLVADVDVVRPGRTEMVTYALDAVPERWQRDFSMSRQMVARIGRGSEVCELHRGQSETVYIYMPSFLLREEITEVRVTVYWGPGPDRRVGFSFPQADQDWMDSCTVTEKMLGPGDTIPGGGELTGVTRFQFKDWHAVYDEELECLIGRVQGPSPNTRSTRFMVQAEVDVLHRDRVGPQWRPWFGDVEPGVAGDDY